MGLHEFEDRARQPLREQQRLWFGPLPLHVNEVHVDAVDHGLELGQRVEPGLGLAPVVNAPANRDEPGMKPSELPKAHGASGACPASGCAPSAPSTAMAASSTARRNGRMAVSVMAKGGESEAASMPRAPVASQHAPCGRLER